MDDDTPAPPPVDVGGLLLAMIVAPATEAEYWRARADAAKRREKLFGPRRAAAGAINEEGE